MRAVIMRYGTQMFTSNRLTLHKNIVYFYDGLTLLHVGRGKKPYGDTLRESDREKSCFTITEEILARSFANFYCQYADRHEFEIHSTRQQFDHLFS